MLGTDFDNLVNKYSVERISADEMMKLCFDEIGVAHQVAETLKGMFDGSNTSHDDFKRKYPWNEANATSLTRAAHVMECLLEGRMPPNGSYQNDNTIGFDELKVAGEILVAPQKTQEAKTQLVNETQGRIDTLAGEAAKRQKEIDAFNAEIASLKSKLSELKTKETHYKTIVGDK